MKLAIKQPYLFPYIGYFQVIKYVDKYIILDDVNFINRGWINRNRILLCDHEHLFTVPLENASQNRLINEICLVSEQKWRLKFLKTIQVAYGKAPQFKHAYPLIESIINNEEKHLSPYICYSIIQLCRYLDIATPVISSSASYNARHLKSQDKIIEICLKEKADEYVDSIGATELYGKEIFREHSIKLTFLKSKPIEYPQNGNEFIPFLSVIDVIMFNEKHTVSQFLNEFEFL